MRGLCFNQMSLVGFPNERVPQALCANHLQVGCVFVWELIKLGEISEVSIVSIRLVAFITLISMLPGCPAASAPDCTCFVPFMAAVNTRPPAVARRARKWIDPLRLMITLDRATTFFLRNVPSVVFGKPFRVNSFRIRSNRSPYNSSSGRVWV